MIQKSSSSDEPHIHFDERIVNTPSRLLFEKGQKIQEQQHECILINYIGCKVDQPGKLILTNFRCIFVVSKQTLYHDTTIRFDFPIGYIARCEGSSESINKVLVFYVQLATKFGFMIKIKSTNHNLLKASQHINSVLNQYDSFGENRGALLPLAERCRKWQDGCFRDENTIEGAVNYDNQAWKYLPMYPQIFKVPQPFVGKRNQHDRIVLLSYVHEGKRMAGLWKSGPGKPDAEEQKWVPSAAKKQDHIVVEIKTKILGSNKSLAQQMIEMDGSVQLRESFMKFFIASCYENEQQQQQQRWLIHANFSRWYEQIQILISQAFLMLQKICEGINVTILSDWDARGSQICALIQLLGKPDNRTILGFGKLIQREFCHFGNYTPSSAKKDRLEDKGIALIQFLDCVFQIMKMYPLSFQFNEDMLTYIAIHIYSRKYGNFLYMTRATTELSQQKFVKYESIWSKIERSKIQFLNPFFVDHKQCDIYEIKKNVGMKNYRIWNSFFFRDILMYGNNIQMNEISKNNRNLQKRHLNIKNQTEVLRSKISQQHKMIADKKKKLKQLQKMQLD